MSILFKTYHGILLLLLFIHVFVLEIFDFNFVGIIFLLFFIYLFIIKLKKGPFPKESEKTFNPILIKIRNNVGWKKNTLVIGISIVIALAAFISIFVIALGGSPVEIWFLNLSFIGLYGLAFLANRILNTNMSIIQTLLVLCISLFTYEHLHVAKALWPNEKGEIYGLSERKYNKIVSAGWDWGEEWHRVQVSKEELPTVIEKFSYHRLNPLIKDTIKVIPFNSIIGIRSISPYDKIDVPCLHWYRKSNSDVFPRIPLHIYYEENSETLLVTQVTEF